VVYLQNDILHREVERIVKHLKYVDSQLIIVCLQLKALIASLVKKLYPHCFVLVGSRNGFERDFTIKLKQELRALEDCLLIINSYFKPLVSLSLVVNY